MNFPARDKQLHFAGGAVIGLSSIAIGPEYALALVALVGGGKELIDYKGYGAAEWADFWWTMAGGAVTVGLVYSW